MEKGFIGMKELERYIPIANMIAKTFGENCEVILHDLSVPQNSVIYAVNNHVTGRRVGQSFDHLIREVLLSKEFSDDYRANYTTYTNDGRMIKSSTCLLRNSQDKVIGALCINFDISAITSIQEMLDDIAFVEPNIPSVAEEIDEIDHVGKIVDMIIEQTIASCDLNNLSRDDKIDLIRFMDSKGVFLIKGSIEKVAEKLNIAKVTVYSYLDEIRKEEA